MNIKNKSVLTLDERRKRGALFFDDDPGLTEQSHKNSCDINYIMATYDKTGMVPVYTGKVPRYDDFSSARDYQSALNLVIEAEEAFSQLSANIRSEFNNDPAMFLAAFEDPAQRAKLIELGVLTDRNPSDQGVPAVEAVKPSNSGEVAKSA